MKRKITFLLLLCSLSIWGQEKAKLVFQTKTIDLGEINSKESPEINVNFVFSNAGKEPLVIHKAKASCGCVTPSWSKSPIKPDGKGIIKINFNTKNQKGIFNKNIFIESNSVDDVILLKIKGYVK